MSRTPVTITPTGTTPMTQLLWSPVAGPEAAGLINRQTNLDEVAKTQLRETAAAILGKGHPPLAGTRTRTGLVVGYVQSGKTHSFTTVIAQARDNSNPLVIFIAGTSVPLFDQTTAPLNKELNIYDEQIPPSWILIPNANTNDVAAFRKWRQDWLDPELNFDEKPTLLITVMKQHRRLLNLADLLDQFDLTEIPSLVIDDEADRASLNTRVQQGRESPTYEYIVRVRTALPNHTFLQYTATPQAPLLINIIDALSPDFVDVLQPGLGYTGGLDFFGQDRRYATAIPPGDIPTPQNPLTAAPDSLLDALAFFIVSVAAGKIEGRSSANPNRSMLVHPSRTTIQHFQYFNAVQNAIADWQTVLSSPATDPDRVQLVQWLTAAYANLHSTVPDLPPFDAILQRLPRAMRDVQIVEVNTRAGQRTPAIEWQRAYGWILVGGQAMDRGFTVRDLTVTYMPRGPGVGNADTLQQRARFFGYKRRYFGHCRIFLETDVLDAFRAYVEHEEQMRSELIHIRDDGLPLAQWKRSFILDARLRPCRANVITHAYARGNFSEDWFFPRALHWPQNVVDENNQIVGTFIARHNFAPDQSYPSRQPAQQHMVCSTANLSDVIENLLVPYRVMDAGDTNEQIGLLLQLRNALDQNQNETNIAHYVTKLSLSHVPLTRTVASRASDEYCKDLRGRPAGGTHILATLPSKTTIVFRFSSIDLTLMMQTASGSLNHVPLVAVWVPRRMDVDWLTQLQSWIMSGGRLHELYKELRGQLTPAGFCALPIPGLERHYLGRGGSGLPADLVSTNDTGFRPPVRLNGMEAQFSQNCTLEIRGQTGETRNFTVLQCTSANAALGNYFLHAMDSVLTLLGDRPTLDHVSESVTSLAEIFQFLGRPAVNTVSGLFGELLVISSAREVAQAVRSWHNDAEERFDFSYGCVRMEVKSARGHLRRHRFTIDQVDPPAGTVGVLCSIILQESAAGDGVLDLAMTIAHRLTGHPVEISKLNRLVAEALGTDVLSANDRKFDVPASRATMQLYNLRTLPAVRRPVDPAVEDVEFSVNFSQVPTMDLDELKPAAQEGFAIMSLSSITADPTCSTCTRAEWMTARCFSPSAICLSTLLSRVWHSQTTTRVQPADWSASATRRSRATLDASLGSQ